MKLTTNPTLRIVVRYIAASIFGASVISATEGGIFGNIAVETLSMSLSALIALVTERAYSYAKETGENL